MIMRYFNIIFLSITKLYSLVKPIKELNSRPENNIIESKSEKNATRHTSRSEILEKIERAQSKNKDLMLDRREAAAFLSITIGTLATWKYAKRYSLPYIKVGRHVRYRASDLINFLESNLNV
jgi:hypothetical protein